MACRINIKSIDYFKFKKLVIDGVRDDYGACSKEVKSLCDSVQTLNFRDEEFDDVSDRARFEEICSSYRQILSSKRIDPTDVRIKSGWWGDHKNAYSAGKLKPAILKETLVAKTKQWRSRNGGILGKLSDSDLASKIDGSGLFVIKHKDHGCFQYVGRADRVFARVAEKLKESFEGRLQEPLAALLVISMVNDWEFYFLPVSANDDERVLRILENDLILKHDSIWPHGLNFCLSIDSLLEVSEFRKSCLRHHWPPDDCIEQEELDLGKLRSQVQTHNPAPMELSCRVLPPPKKKAPKTAEPPPTQAPAASVDWDFSLPLEIDIPEPDFGDGKSPEEVEEEIERPGSGMSTGTYVVTGTPTGSPKREDVTIIPITPPPTPKSKTAQRPISAGKPKPQPGSKPTVRPISGRERPTTPRRMKPQPASPKKGARNNNNPGEFENEAPNGDTLEDEMSHSHSSASLSDGAGSRGTTSPETPKAARRSAAARAAAAKARPTSAKTRQEKSRLPVAASSGPLRHQNRD